MDSILIVVYSHTGTSRKLATQLSTQEGWPLGEVVEEHARVGASGALSCVLDSLLKRQPRIRYDGPDPADFHTVVLVAPIWVGRLAGPMRSFVATHRAQLHHVAVLVTMGSTGAPNAFAEVGRLLDQTPVLTAAFTEQQVADGSGKPRLIEFGQALRPGTAPQDAHRVTGLERELRTLRTRLPAHEVHHHEGPDTWREPHG